MVVPCTITFTTIQCWYVSVHTLGFVPFLVAEKMAIQRF